jgi:hypothetical protein
MAASAVASSAGASAQAPPSLLSHPRHGHKTSSLADVDAQSSSVAPAKTAAGHTGQKIDRTV